MSNDLERQRELQNQVRQNLEAILKNSNSDNAPLAQGNVMNIDVPVDPFSTEKAEHPHAKPMDFHREKKALEKEARKTVASAMKFYVDSKLIGKEEYLEAKKNIDAMTLSNLLFSMKFTQQALIKIMEDIDMGNTHPRTFEALATLNGQLMSIVKTTAAFNVTMENAMRQAQLDLAMKDHRENQPVIEDADAEVMPGEPTRVRGTKALMQGIKKEIDLTPPENTRPELTDPGTRPVNPFDDGTEKKEDEGDDIIDATEYFA
jgi:hypothetical protein